MGNHEYCEDCGESSFHHGRDCDPKKVLAIKEMKRQSLEKHAKALAIMEEKLQEAGIPYSLETTRFSEEYPYAVVRPDSFYNKIDHKSP